jgi:hypothetical protein
MTDFGAGPIGIGFAGNQGFGGGGAESPIGGENTTPAAGGGFLAPTAPMNYPSIGSGEGSHNNLTRPNRCDGW